VQPAAAWGSAQRAAELLRPGCRDLRLDRRTYSWRFLTTQSDEDELAGRPGRRSAGWLPLLPTPPQPEYPSAHTSIAAAYAAVLTSRLGPGPAQPLVLTSGGVTRTFSTWEQLVRENVDGRVWAGVHYRHSDLVGAELGRQVAAYDLDRSR